MLMTSEFWKISRVFTSKLSSSLIHIALVRQRTKFVALEIIGALKTSIRAFSDGGKHVGGIRPRLTRLELVSLG